MKTGNKVFENVADFKYFETTVTNQNYINANVEGFNTSTVTVSRMRSDG